MLRIAHIINPFQAPAGSELAIAQPITFESMRAAQRFAHKMEVQLYAACFEEDKPVVPEGFTLLPFLKHSVLDKGTFAVQKKLPFIKEIIELLYRNTDAEYLVYTNVDIALMPQFYASVGQLINEGHDALLINRRGISVKYNSVDELPKMYAEIGVPHPGFDFFLFKRELVSKMILGDVCIGVPFAEVTLLHNLIAFANNLKLVDDGHLTFHIGTEVMPPRDKDYYLYNRGEYEKNIYPQLKPHLDTAKFPYAESTWYKRIIKWAINPSFRTHQVLEMEGKGFWRKLKFTIDGYRWRLLERLK